MLSGESLPFLIYFFFSGVFKEVVEWCLVVTTPEEVILCALARSDSNALRLIPTRYTIPTDNIPILSVCGTHDGRIFLGGFDGSLYEMTYESLAPSFPTTMTIERKWNAFYDGNNAKPDMTQSNVSLGGQILSNGKRAFSNLMIGSARPRKCRKLNHSQTAASSVISAVIPDFVLKASSALLWSSDLAIGGIIQILHDAERSCIFTLSAKGWISSYDLRGDFKLTARMDTEKSARIYLGAVSRGLMYPPTSSTNAATIAFPGGGSSAQAGVGGMDGARSILKSADNDTQTNGRGGGQTGKARAKLLAPISIHVISRQESGRLTLMAVTAGGLRYYLSSLSPNVLNSGPGAQNLKGDPLAPSKQFTLCYVRAPPPVDSCGILREVPSYDSEATGVVDGLTPRLVGTTGIHVDAAIYKDGVTFLAVEHKGSTSTETTGNPTNVGNVIVAITPDAVARKKAISKNTEVIEVPGGVSEAIALPMSSESAFSGILPGGRIVDAKSVSPSKNSALMNLVVHSQTPSDGDLANCLPPPYVPLLKGRNNSKTKSVVGTVSHSALELASTSRLGAIIRSNGSIASPSSIAFTIMSNFLLSRPLRHGLAYQNSLPGSGLNESSAPLYRISKRYGCTGFSKSAGGNVSSDRHVSVGSASKLDQNETARLSPWLLRPAVVPLNRFALHHLTTPDGFVALNAGGAHYFNSASVLTSLADALMSAGANVGKDETVSKFFKSYGYTQGCAMCLMIATGTRGVASRNGESEELRNRACRAALSRAFVPALLYKATATTGATGDIVIRATQSDEAIPPEYEFKPSCLSDGLNLLSSRLLRPIWYKPAVVVTEGQIIQRKGGATRRFPAKVELLLDDETLEEVRRPLVSLQNLMREMFAPAISVVPGVDSRDEMGGMDIDEFGAGQSLLITGSMSYRGQLQVQNGAMTPGQLAPSDVETIARLLEERSLHSLYRLLSRSVQLLSLLSLLKRAQLMPDLPEVEWGLLHGVTVAQLVQTSEGQDRIETLLNALVSSNKSLSTAQVKPANDADELVNLFATQCYLYYSPGSRLAYLGFRDANEALSCAPSSPRRTALTNQAVAYFKRATSFWYSAPMVSGRTLHSKDKESYYDMAVRALQFDSPLATAASKLLQLGDVVALVDVCLATAANFHKSCFNEMTIWGEEGSFGGGLKWEQGLYHKRRKDSQSITNSSSSSASSALVLHANVTQEDARNTCYAIILHNLTILLEGRNTVLADKMVSACAAASEKEFLHAFFEHLKSRGQSKTLVRIASKQLEQWLQEEDEDLLYRYYVVQEQHVQAGQLMWARANKEDSFSLDQRLEWLIKARNSYNSALDALTRAPGWNEQSTVNPVEIRKFATLVQDTVDVAQLQRSILSSVCATNLESQLSPDKLQNLKTSLVSVSDLYNEFAGPLNLFDSCLFILHNCRQNSPQNILKLWSSVLCEEILPCATRSKLAYNVLQKLSEGSLLDEQVVLLGSDGQNIQSLPLFEHGLWVDTLKIRVVSLGKELYGKGTDFVCPIDFLAARLEELRHAQQLLVPSSELGSRNSPWPLRILTDIGIPYSLALNAYEGIVVNEEKERMGGIDPHSRFIHLRSIVELLENWAQAARREGVVGEDLCGAVATGMLMARLDGTKADLEELKGAVNGDALERVYERLLSAENSIKRLV